MNRRPTIIFPLLLLAALVAACTSAPVGVTAVEILSGDRALEPGAETLLSAYVSASEGIATTVSWSSDAASVASVSSDGTVSAHAVGSAIITATSIADASKSDSITVTVALDPASPETTEATYLPSATYPPAVGLALYFQAMPPELSIAPTHFTEVMEGLFFGPLSPIAEDGSVALVLPDTTAVPVEIMSTATAFTMATDGLPGCALSASDATVGVTQAGSILMGGNTGVAVMTIDGAEPGFAVDGAIDPDSFTEAELLAVGHVTWVYAEEDVSVVATGAGCTSGAVSLDVDLELAAGWNQLTWDYEFDGTDITGVTLRNSDGEPVFVIASTLI